MGIEHIINDLDASEMNIGYTPLIPSGLEYLNFFGGSAPVGRNLAPGKPQGVVVGSPVVGSMAEGVTFTNTTNYVQTDVSHVQAMTFLAIGRVNGDGEYIGISNYRSNGFNATLRLRTLVAGTSLQANMVSAYTSGDTSTPHAASTGSSAGNTGVMAFAGRFNHVAGTPGIRVNLLTSGLVANANGNIPAGATQDIGGKFRIGSGYGSLGGTVPFPILFAAIWSRELSDQELAEQYAQLKEFYQTTKGVAI